MDFAGRPFEMVVNDESIEEIFTFAYPHITEPRHDDGKINYSSYQMFFKVFPSKKPAEIARKNHENEKSYAGNQYRKQPFCEESPPFKELEKIMMDAALIILPGTHYAYLENLPRVVAILNSFI